MPEHLFTHQTPAIEAPFSYTHFSQTENSFQFISTLFQFIFSTRHLKKHNEDYERTESDCRTTEKV